MSTRLEYDGLAAQRGGVCQHQESLSRCTKGIHANDCPDPFVLMSIGNGSGWEIVIVTSRTNTQFASV